MGRLRAQRKNGLRFSIVDRTLQRFLSPASMPELFSGYHHFKTKALKIGLAILHVALIFYCVFSFGRRWNVASSGLFWGAFLFRLAAGIILGVVYTYYYTAGDTWLFFED